MCCFHVSTVETLRRLISRDLEEDRWSHDSDDTPTNETANEESSLSERQRPESLETVLNFSTNDWEAEPVEVLPSDTEQPSVQVIRKGSGSEQLRKYFILSQGLLISFNFLIMFKISCMYLVLIELKVSSAAFCLFG